MTDDGNAKIFATLMKDVLGYKTFFGSRRRPGPGHHQIARQPYPENVTAIHLTDVDIPTDPKIEHHV